MVIPILKYRPEQYTFSMSSEAGAYFVEGVNEAGDIVYCWYGKHDACVQQLFDIQHMSRVERAVLVMQYEAETTIVPVAKAEAASIRRQADEKIADVMREAFDDMDEMIHRYLKNDQELAEYWTAKNIQLEARKNLK